MGHERAMKRIRWIDKLSCDTYSLWNSLESLKEAIAEDAGISKNRLEAEGIFSRNAEAGDV